MCYPARSLGGILIGHIGGRHGRKFAKPLSVPAMASPTFLIGILVVSATAALLVAAMPSERLAA